MSIDYSLKSFHGIGEECPLQHSSWIKAIDVIDSYNGPTIFNPKLILNKHLEMVQGLAL